MRETLTLLHMNNKCADQPAHPRSLISAFVICSLECTIAKFFFYESIWSKFPFFFGCYYLEFFGRFCDVVLSVQSYYDLLYLGLVATKPVFGVSDKARLKPVS